MRPQGGVHWLSRDLLVRLMLPLLAIVAATGALGTYTAHRLTERVFDHWLLDAARSVGALVRFEHGRASLDLASAAQAVLLYDDIDRIDFSVIQGERLLAGRRSIPQSGQHEVIYPRGRAYETGLDGKRVRVARVDLDDSEGQGASVLVSETLVKRQRSERELVEVLWPLAVFVLATAVAILVAVRRTVRPLERIAARWNERSHASLQPIADHDVPHELLPFATALNDLLGRIRTMLAAERQFAATAAHQLRTPLTGLQLGLARAAEAPDLPTARAVIGELNHATQRTARLVQQLLSLGSLNLESRGDFGFVSADLGSLALDVGTAHADQALAKAIEFELLAPTEPVLANVQPELIAETLSNLLDNAIRYTSSGGRVRIEVLDQSPRIRVSDSGPGIPEDERERVFERFVRGRSATGDGSGLGLAIVRDIAAAHRAKVTLSDSDWGGLSVMVAFASDGDPD
ncbi:sensor histidine kinase [uncultured Thiodictyon sp.]|uniref:sensor histidine kinase n=1 Tax=uncultured Thiodictyon sp. TaxID=1846217 RepID=UPI0025D0E42F|nr:sensor histidine kinase [uncultured Thiodictyon sp.]